MSETDYYGALPVGYQLHEYFIERVLGQGGFGITYLAHDANLNKKVAIKEYLPENFAVRAGRDRVRPKPNCETDFAWGLKRFLNEAQTLGQFHHPNIVPVLRFFEINGTAYMVMSYQHGEGLGTILDRHGTLEESELEEILYPLLDGLRLVHDAGILHRDIKPDNIYIRADATPVLLDFGAARHAIGQRGRNITRIITPNYAPPEQYYSEGHLGPWTDVYALAAVMYEAIAGTPPPEAPARLTKDRMRGAARMGKGRYRRKFLEAIDRGLALAPEDRPQTIAEWIPAFPEPLMTGLRAARERASRAPAAASTVPSGDAPPPRPDAKANTATPTRRGPPAPAIRARRWIAAAAVVFVLIAAGATALVLRRDVWPGGPDAGIAATGDRPGGGPAVGGEARGSIRSEAEEDAERPPEASERSSAGLRRVFAGRRAFVRLPREASVQVLEFRANGRLIRQAFDANVVGRWSADGWVLCLNLPDRLPQGNECFRITRLTNARAGRRDFAGRGRTGSIRGEIHY